MRDVRSERFHDSDLTSLLNGHRDQRAHDPEGRDDHDEEQQEKHNRALEPHGFEVLMIHVDPSLCVLRGFEKLLHCLFYALGAVWVICLDGDTVQCVTQAVQLLPHVNWNEKKLGIVQVMTGLKNAGDGQFLRENHVAQFVDRFFFFFALGVFQFLNAIENLTKITRRIDRDLVTDTHL